MEKIYLTQFIIIHLMLKEWTDLRKFTIVFFVCVLNNDEALDLDISFRFFVLIV